MATSSETTTTQTPAQTAEPCVELSLDTIAAVYAFPVGTLAFDSPVYVRTATPSQSNDYASGYRIPMDVKSFKYADKVDAKVYGRVHSITLQWDSNPKRISDLSTFYAMESTAHEIVILFFGGHRRIIRTDPDAYRFAFPEQDGQYKCSMTLTNGQGLIDL